MALLQVPDDARSLDARADSVRDLRRAGDAGDAGPVAARARLLQPSAGLRGGGQTDRAAAILPRGHAHGYCELPKLTELAVVINGTIAFPF